MTLSHDNQYHRVEFSWHSGSHNRFSSLIQQSFCFEEIVRRKRSGVAFRKRRKDGIAFRHHKSVLWPATEILWEVMCQSAPKFDPGSASNFDPFERRVLTVALASSELAGVAETWRARAA